METIQDCDGDLGTFRFIEADVPADAGSFIPDGGDPCHMVALVDERQIVEFTLGQSAAPLAKALKPALNRQFIETGYQKSAVILLQRTEDASAPSLRTIDTRGRSSGKWTFMLGSIEVASRFPGTSRSHQ